MKGACGKGCIGRFFILYLFDNTQLSMRVVVLCNSRQIWFALISIARHYSFNMKALTSIDDIQLMFDVRSTDFEKV